MLYNVTTRLSEGQIEPPPPKKRIKIWKPHDLDVQKTLYKTTLHISLRVIIVSQDFIFLTTEKSLKISVKGI